MWGAVNEKYDFIKAFEKKYPNIHINLTQINEGDYSEKLNTMVASKTAPDVMLVWECDIGRFAKNGVIERLDNYIKNTKAFTMSDFIPAVSKLTQLNGGVYGLPWCFATHLLYYNKDMFDKAGVPYPNGNWTWQDFRDAAKKLTIVKNGKVVQWGTDALGFYGVWYSLIGEAGDKIVDNNGNLSIGDGAKRALQFEYDLVNKDKVAPPPSAGTNNVDLFRSGRAAMIMNGSWMISTYRDIQNFKWDIAPLPKDKRAYANLHTAFFTINSNSKYKDAAWKFIEFCMSDEGQKLISEGTNNPSARVSVNAKGYYKIGGKNGPTNWAALDDTAKYAEFGYVLLPPAVTNDLVNRFNAVVLGQVSIDTALKQGLDHAKEIMNK